MRRIVLVLLASIAFTAGQSQPAAIALEGTSKTLQERYYLMKTKSETFQDYKVIKENILDGVWKIQNDSLSNREHKLEEANSKIKALQNEVKVALAALKSKEDSMAEIVLASTHINVIGINFSKTSFQILTFIVTFLLFVTILLLMARMKAMTVFVKESKLIVTSTAHELEEYKRKAFETQTKLARELQTERNKLMELKASSKAQ